MKTKGHKTKAMYDRYNIRNETDLIEAAKELSALEKMWKQQGDAIGE